MRTIEELPDFATWKESGKWKAIIHLPDQKQIFWTYDTQDGALGKLKELLQAANEISLTEVLG